MTKSLILPQLDAWEKFILRHCNNLDIRSAVYTLGQGRLLMIQDVRRMCNGETVLPPEASECANISPSL
jgi:hypothetical protein